ncbi:hypothetical protein QAD02_015932 [Eretmocerus hayati]|uniref:Uncharacterized protein n=1 Tax=Eretmocerus hayati TaxID=131215 RepID=A0ACC2PEE3_9HYME|nr:hypothetical protein QAD02_015932 [Eretmocerus hayati]
MEALLKRSGELERKLPNNDDMYTCGKGDCSRMRSQVPSPCSEAYPDCRESILSAYKSRGLSDDAANIIVNSLAPNTLKQYGFEFEEFDRKTSDVDGLNSASKNANCDLNRNKQHLQKCVRHKKPHKAAFVQTLSNWLNSVLAECGLSEFTGLTTQQTSASAAFAEGVDLNVLKNAAGWSEKSRTSDKYHNRPIVQPNTTLAERVIRKKKK